MQLRLLAPLCLTAPTHPHNWLHTCALTCFPPYMHIFWVVCMSTCTDVCQRWCQAVGGERRGAARSRTMPLSHRISQAGGQRRTAVGMTLQFCSGREWRRAGEQRGQGDMSLGCASLVFVQISLRGAYFPNVPSFDGVPYVAAATADYFFRPGGFWVHVSVVLVWLWKQQSYGRSSVHQSWATVVAILAHVSCWHSKILLTLHQKRARNNKPGYWKFENLYFR